jgi:hypothetical protein
MPCFVADVFLKHPVLHSSLVVFSDILFMGMDIRNRAGKV